MENFADVARARASYQSFVAALNAGREILRRAGVPDPPPVPEFDAVFRRLAPEARLELFATLNEAANNSPAEALKLWQPVMRRAFAPVRR